MRHVLIFFPIITTNRIFPESAYQFFVEFSLFYHHLFYPLIPFNSVFYPPGKFFFQYYDVPLAFVSLLPNVRISIKDRFRS